MGRAAAVVWAAALSFLCGCATGPSGSSKRAVNAYLAAGQYAQADQYLDSVKESQYGRKNMVLFYLDKGTILNHLGKYKESDAAFDRAEQRAQELYTKSVTQAGGMLLLNDTTMEYAGEPFERALLNVFRALDYVFLGQPDEALVESRKVEVFLDGLGRHLQGQLTYKDDAFARYLDSLLYADAGRLDDARISREAAEAAYGWYTSLYHMPAPRFDLPDVPRDSGELVFIHYNGIAPRKVSRTWQLAWGEAMFLARSSGDSEMSRAQVQNALRAGVARHAVTVAYPDYVQDPYRVVSSDLEIDGGQERAGTLLMESISAIARRDLQDRMALTKARAVARAAVKYILAEAASKAAEQECDKQFGVNTFGDNVCRATARALSHGTAAATEIADTRGWAALPAEIRMARVQVPAGTHDVTVRFKDSGGAILSTYTFKGVTISKGKRTYLGYRTAI